MRRVGCGACGALPGVGGVRTAAAGGCIGDYIEGPLESRLRVLLRSGQGRARRRPEAYPGLGVREGKLRGCFGRGPGWPVIVGERQARRRGPSILLTAGRAPPSA